MNKLLRVSAWVLRFIKNVKAKRDRQGICLDSLKVEEIKYAELQWVRDAQKQLQVEDKFKKTKESLGICEVDKILVCKGRLESFRLFSLRKIDSHNF